VPIQSHQSFAVVMHDVVTGLGDSFTPRFGDAAESFRVAERFEEADVIGNDQIAAVPWTYFAVHSGDFLCLFPTNREVTIQGMTFVDNRKDDPVLHRYVDWTGVIVQLGLEVSWRIPVTEEEYAFGRARVP
jgi:hypothetical protein